MTAAPTRAPATPPERRLVRTTFDGSVAIVTLDDERRPVNTLTQELAGELVKALDAALALPEVASAVLVSGKPDFVVGANVEVLKTIRFAEDAERLARQAGQELVRLARRKKPVVAAVHGAVLGGGLELALACRAIVASDDARTLLALPEVQLGLLPGANGLLRVAERAGLEVALDLGLTGKRVDARKAKRLGLVDEVCPASVLVEVATARARALASPPKNPPRPTFDVSPEALRAFALERTPLGRAFLFKKARERSAQETRGHYPAADRILQVLERYASKGFAAGADLEARLFGELVVSETSHRLIEIFFAQTALKKDPGVDDARVVARPLRRVAVVGGGLMGGGVAYVTAAAGIPTRLKEKDDASLGRALRQVRGSFDEKVARRRLTPEARDHAFGLLTGGTDVAGLRGVDVVIEAVFEDLALKQSVLREVEAETRDDCVFASNTSSIPVARIAEASRRPETVVGMHYFSPVPKMLLLEVVRTEATAPWVVATAVALGKKQGKTCIVVKDGAGFYTSRILAPFLNEAAHLLGEGVTVEAIDRALVDWGFPVGPLQLLDEVGIDVAAHVGEIVHAAYGDRMLPAAALGRLVADHRKGRKNERGFYTYGAEVDAAKGPRPVDKSIYRALGVEPRAKLPVEEIQMRCALMLVNEALLAFGDGVLRSPRDGDLGAIFGLGFPPFRGGPFRYVDAIGAAELLRRIQGYADRFGPRWSPAPALAEMARKGTRFYAD